MTSSKGAETFHRELETNSAAETVALGERLGALLAGGHFLGLIGELGAGKTQLVRGIASGAGVASDEISSPTFAIVHPYRGTRIVLHHADLYRLADVDELHVTGFFDLLDDATAMMVEWINQVWEAAPEDRLLIHLAAPDPHRPDWRTMKVDAEGPRSVTLARAWLGDENAVR